MRTVQLPDPVELASWRDAARQLLAEGVPPEAITWQSNAAGDQTSVTSDLFASHRAPAAPGKRTEAPTLRVPRDFVELAERVLCHRDPHRHALLYRVLWRRSHGEPRLLERIADPDMHRLHTLSKAVSRDRHKMTAFVRFRRTPGVDPAHYTAWFEPEHRIEALTAGFFRRRFSTMRFSIYTPEASVHWDGRTLVLAGGADRECLPDEEAMEALWCEYYANIFNPARLKLSAMRSEMPVKYWKNLPEAPLIAALSRDAGARERRMIDAPATRPARHTAASALKRNRRPAAIRD